MGVHLGTWVCLCMHKCVCVSCVVPAPAYVLKGLEVQGFGRMVIIFMK